MKHEQLEAWKRVRNAGTVALVFGWLGIALSVFLVLLSVLFFAINTPIETTSTYGSATESVPSFVYGLLFLVIALVFILPFSIIDIVAGTKLRKPIAKPRGWIIYLIVIGALSVTSLGGVLELIFGILALSSLHTIDGTEPPKQLS